MNSRIQGFPLFHELLGPAAEPPGGRETTGVVGGLGPGAWKEAEDYDY